MILYTAYIVFWAICKRFHGLSNDDDHEEREKNLVTAMIFTTDY